MIRFALGALLGALSFHQLPYLPSWPWVCAAAVLLGVAWYRRLVFLSGLAGFFLWACVSSAASAPALFPDFDGGVDVLLEGQVVSLVERSGDRARFVLRADRAVLPEDRLVQGDWRIRLTWYRNAPALLRPDQRWRLTVRLRPAHGHANPGGFDFEGWLYRRGIVYTGYVRPAGGGCTAFCGGKVISLTGLRQHIADRVSSVLGHNAGSGVLKALVIGDRSGVGSELWSTFRMTGTSHLMAISGLHIGLIAGVAGGLGTLTWRRLPRLCGRWPAKLVGGVLGMTAAVAYAALAGFTIPTQRALIMLAVLMIGFLGRREIPPARVLAMALLAVLARDPGAVGEPGFWLSFAAVAIILVVLTGARHPTGWRNLIRIQLAIGLGLSPALFALGLPVSLSGLLVNPLVIPLFGMLIVPLALLGVAVFTSGLDPDAIVLQAASYVIELVSRGLSAFAQLPGGVVHRPAPEIAVLALATIGVGLLLMPRGMPGRAVGLVMLAPLVFGPNRHESLSDGDFRATALDVGQGLAVAVETRRHLLVFDTGPAFRGGFDTGAAVVAPYLRYRGWREIDRLILSHADRDHAGGTAGLLRAVPARAISGGEPVAHEGLPVSPCAAGDSWHWDGVTFDVLYPKSGIAVNGNEASCVLRISNAAGRLLLTGDAETQAEQQLLATYGSALAARVVVAPHHGSRTSSSQAFVAATHPEFVIFTTGFRNSYGFPASEVAERWRQAGAILLDTAASGAVWFEYRHDRVLLGPFEFRDLRRRYWHYAGPAH